MVSAISKTRAKQQHAPAGVALGSTTSNPSSASDKSDSEAITVGPVAGKTQISGKTSVPGKTKSAKNSIAAKTTIWEMTAEEALRVNFVEFEI